MTAYPGLGVTGNGVGVVTPTMHKLAQSGLIAKSPAAFNQTRPGLFYNGVTDIVTGTANMSYNVAGFTAALSRGASAGTVLLANDGTVNVATTAAPGSNSRIDIVYVWQREFSLDGTDSNPVIGVAQGTAAASPVAPSLAAFPGALELGRIVVPAGVTATTTGTTITQTAPFTTTDGGIVSFRSNTERDAATLLPGQASYVTGTGEHHLFSGGQHRQIVTAVAWQTPTLSTGITVTGGYLAPRYRIVSGAVEISVPGLDGSAGSGFALFVLPVGYRPAATVRIPATSGGYVEISSAGVVNSTITGAKSAVAFSGMFWF